MLFPVGLNQSYAQATVEVMVIPSADFAPDQALTYPIGSPNTLTIPFSTFVTVEGTDYDDLTITFALSSLNRAVFSSFTSFTNVNATGPLTAEDDTLLVTGDTVVVTNIFTSNFVNPVHFPYTVTNTDGAFDRGVITFTPIGSVMANVYTVTLPNLLDLTELDLQISPNTLATEFLSGTTFGDFGLFGYVFTTNGTGVDGAGGGGNASGTLTITNAVSSATFLYTPVQGFAGTEAFSYNVVDGDGNDGSSTLYIVVPARVCSVSGVGNHITVENQDDAIQGLVNGELSVSSLRYTMINSGNVLNQPTIRAEDWKSDADDTITMLAKESRYGTDNSISYDDRTPLTSEPAIISNANSANAARINAGETIETGTPLGIFDGTGGTTRDNREFLFFQVLVDLIDSEFEGLIIQQLTITSNCPE